ncbi:MAG: DUF4038 domain-containing protein [Sphingobacteriaceae bacterium]
MMRFLILFLGAVCLTTEIHAQHLNHTFPLKVSMNKRYLIDNDGHPFLYHADTAWMLFLNLNREETLQYLIARKAQSFNVIQVILVGFADFNGKPPINRFGQKPFLIANDFSTVNLKYFEHVAWVIRKADSLGLALSIAPLWAGCCGEGWAGKGKAMDLNKPEGNFKFGKFLGTYFGKFKNVQWILGGDSDPENDKENYRQLALGIKRHSPKQLITYHAASSHSSTDVWEKESWLDFTMVYTYFRGFNKAWNKNQPDVYEVSWEEYGKHPVTPFILGESTYEGEHDSWGSALQARKQAYWAVLGGASGHAYGSPIWKVDKNWRKYLNLPGAKSLKHFYKLFSALQWEKLVPDTGKKVAISGNGEFANNNYSTTAISNDNRFSVSYLPSPRTLSIDLAQIKGKSLTAKWHDPIEGKEIDIKEPLEHNITSFTPPPGNHDWVLVISGSARAN